MHDLSNVNEDSLVVVLQAGQIKLADAEKLLIVATLKKAQFNRTHAARLLGIGIRTLQRKIKQYSEECKTEGQPLEIRSQRCSLAVAV